MALVRELEELLREAKAGEVKAIACVGARDGDRDFQLIIGQESTPELLKFIGLLEMAKVSIVAGIMEEAE